MIFKSNLHFLRIIIFLIIVVLFLAPFLHIVTIFVPGEYISEITKSLFFKSYFPDRSFPYPEDGIQIYLAGNSVLFGYLAYKLINAFKVVHRTIQNKIFYTSLASDIEKVANAIITYAQLKFLLILICGVFFLIAPVNVISYLTTFFILYILGKILIFVSELAKRGEILKEDIDLTI